MDTSTDENLMKIACESNLLWSQWTKKLEKSHFQKKKIVTLLIFQNETF